MTAGVQALYFGGPAGSEALYGFSMTAPDGKGSRVFKVNAAGAVTFFDSPDLALPYVNGVGSVAVSRLATFSRRSRPLSPAAGWCTSRSCGPERSEMSRSSASRLCWLVGQRA
jgi:hypothetical protein